MHLYLDKVEAININRREYEYYAKIDSVRSSIQVLVTGMEVHLVGFEEVRLEMRDAHCKLVEALPR
jgi:hypothetical protein